MSPSLTLRFPAPNNPLSINKANVMHWGARKRALDPWREATGICWLAARRDWPLVKNKPCSVQIHFPFQTRRRRDPHNLTGTNGKAIIDALVQAGAWPDDTAEWVQFLDPVIKYGGDVEIVITPLCE